MLTQLGLSRKAEVIYKTLLETGEVPITTLSKKSGLKRPTVYLIVDELEMLGLISRVKKGKRNLISPIHPRRVAQIAQLRAKTIEEKLPELTALYNAPKDKPKIQMFEGVNGVREIYKDVYASLSNKKEALWFTRIDALEKVPDSMNEFLKLIPKLKNPRIRELNYDNDAARKWLLSTKKVRGSNHEIRFAPQKYEFGLTDNLIFENKVVIFSLSENIFALVVESKQVTKTYRALFEMAWSCSVE